MRVWMENGRGRYWKPVKIPNIINKTNINRGEESNNRDGQSHNGVEQQNNSAEQTKNSVEKSNNRQGIEQKGRTVEKR